MAGVFLFNIFCSIVSCDPVFKLPTPRPTHHPLHKNEFGNPFLKEYRERRNFDFVLESGLDPNHIKSFGRPPPLVETEAGLVEGYFMKIINGREIYAFEGIPYAEPPNGKRRFRSPVPKGHWKGIRQAKNPGPICLQMHPFKIYRVVGDEDCLTVNIYSPMIPAKGHNPNLSVLIWIHGGSYFYGSGSEYGPAYLLQKDVVLVTLNYRLGPLGFLSSGDEEAPGNWGLKDQALAIKWVADNIGAFGGNAKSITLIGQSAGGISVHFHMMSNMTKHLFQRGISMSGTALGFILHTPHQARKWAEKLGRFLKCPIHKGTKILMDCFRSQDPAVLTGNQFNLFDFFPLPLIFHRPVVEPNLPGAYLTISPEEAYEQNQVARIPFIKSTTSAEMDFFGLILTATGFLPLWLRNWERIAPTLIDYRLVAGSNVTAVTHVIADFYYGGRDIAKISGPELTQPLSDHLMYSPDRKALMLHSKIAPTYASIFSYRNPYGIASLFGIDPNQWGVFHTEDIPFIFNSSTYSQAWNGTEKAFAVSELMIDFVTNFARKGEPLATDRNGVDNHIWDPVDPRNPMFLGIGKEVKMIPDPRKREVAFWNWLNLNESYAYEYA